AVAPREETLVLAPRRWDRVTENPSAPATAVSPATLTVMVLLASPTAKLSVPDGNTPPTKSAASAGGPLTAQSTLEAPLRSPVRDTVKVNGVAPELPSALSASVAGVDRAGAAGMWSLRMAPGGGGGPVRGRGLGAGGRAVA